MNCIKWGARILTREDIEGKKIIEVGSYDVNGSLRYIVELLKPSEYVGIDIAEGPGVDVVCASENLVQKFGKEKFDVVLSTCTFEHIRNWKESISNIKNICKKNGIIIFIVPSRWPYHSYPYDYWRYGKEDVKNIFSDCDILTITEDKEGRSLVYAKIKKPSNFTENNLSDYKLYSIITNKKITQIKDDDLKSFYFKYLFFIDKMKNFAMRIAKKI